MARRMVKVDDSSQSKNITYTNTNQGQHDKLPYQNCVDISDFKQPFFSEYPPERFILNKQYSLFLYITIKSINTKFRTCY